MRVAVHERDHADTDHADTANNVHSSALRTSSKTRFRPYILRTVKSRVDDSTRIAPQHSTTVKEIK
jgi:hypothetical protein